MSRLTTNASGALVLCALLLVAACGGGTQPPDAPSLAVRGENVARQRGCVACHTVNGRAGVGPTWKGLAGSEVELTDGTRVVADTAYLTQSIREPAAQRVKGFTTTMPQIELGDGDLAALVAYIESRR